MEQESRYPGSRTPTLDLNQGEEHRRQLANFLKTRREALTPAALGLPQTRRRRVRGLRREEVAEAAGISVAWYTWIEQARDLKLSADTLKRLSLALRLSVVEQGHLYRLAGYPPPHPVVENTGDILPILRRMILAMDPNPTYVLDPLWNLVLWNKQASKLFGRFEELEEKDRNMVRLIFLDQRFRELFSNWSQVACCMLGHFRSDSANHVETTSWQGLVKEVASGSSEFRMWWKHHNVTSPFHLRKEIMHPQCGRQFYDSLDLELFQPGRYRIVTYVLAADPPEEYSTATPLT